MRTLFWTVGKEKEVKSKDGNKQQDCAGLCHLLLEMYRDGKRKKQQKIKPKTHNWSYADSRVFLPSATMIEQCSLTQATFKVNIFALSYLNILKLHISTLSRYFKVTYIYSLISQYFKATYIYGLMSKYLKVVYFFHFDI